MKKWKFPVVKWIIDIYKPFRKHLLVMFVFVIGLEILTLLSPVIYGKVIDSIFLRHSLETTLLWVGISFLLYSINAAVDNVRDQYTLKHFDFKVSQHVSNLVFRKNLSFSMGQHLSTHSGIKQSIVNRGQSSLTSMAFIFSFEIFPDFLRMVFIIGAILYTSFVIGGIVLTGIAVFVYMTLNINKLIVPKAKKLQKLWNINGKMQQEFMANISVIQSHSQESKVSKEYDRHIGGIGKFGRILWSSYTTVTTIRSFISIITRVIIMVVGVIYVYHGTYLPGYLVILLSWSSDIFHVLGQFGRKQRQIIEMYSAVKKLHTLYILEPEVKIIENPVCPGKYSGKIEFKNVSFSYPTRNSEILLDESEKEKSVSEKSELAKETLRGVSFLIEKGETVAFVGPSGAGKTTIVNLLLRAFDPINGQIIIDGNDLRILDLHNYRGNVGYVEQNVSLFDNTLAYNILFGLNGKARYVTKDELDRIARMSCVDKFYNKLEKGFDTIIGERGIWLSGGERQRVGIARALAKNPAIMIFDEATSNLDSQNESLIRESINAVSVGRTTIIIAHRFSTIKDVDKIIVLDQGKIVGQGKHDFLLESCEEYVKLVQKQL